MDKKKIDYEELTSFIYDFIYDIPENYLCLEELIYDEKICDIILKNYDFKYLCDKIRYDKKFNFQKVIELSKDFLRKIDEKYAERLEENLNENNITFNNELNKSYVNYTDDDKKEIYVSLDKTITDIFALTHEEIHDVAITLDCVTDTEDIFCEVPTILSELLLADFLQDKVNKKDIEIYKKEALTSYVVQALSFKVQYLLIRSVMDKGYIDKKTMQEIIFEINDICDNETITVEIIEEVLYNSEKDFYFFDLRYLNGIILGTYIHEKILSNPKLLKEFSAYNEGFAYQTICQVLKSIGLDIVNEEVLELSSESYNNLEKSFQKELRRIYK